MKKFFTPTIIKLLLGAFVVCMMPVLFYAGYRYRNNQFTQYLSQFQPVRAQVRDLDLISPLVGIDSPNALSIGLHSDTQEKLMNLIADAKKNDGLITTSIYFRDLDSSIWFGINESEEFIPASLLKMTYAFAAYKESEDEPGFLDKQIVYTQDMANETKSRANADDATALAVGKVYSVRDLVSIMLIQSDNGARDALVNLIKPDYVNQVFTYLGIQAPEAVNNFQISTEEYALFFRMLYGATFINDEHSEELLTILTKTVFPFGITRELPSKIAVAHKWGVYNFPQTAPNVPPPQELHDCGIVYVPNKPYLVCIMTKGTNQDKLAKFISDASKILYDDATDNNSDGD